VPKEKFEALPQYETSALFDEVERLVIRYAEQMTTRVQVDTALVEQLAKHHGGAARAAHPQHRRGQLHQPLQRGARHRARDPVVRARRRAMRLGVSLASGAR